MSIYYLLLLLEIFGLSIAAYLISERLRHEAPYCVIGEDCNQVLKSEYNRIFGVNNDLMGALYYCGMIGLSVLLHFDLGPATWWLPILKLMALTGVAMSLFLLYLQWKVIESWCFWCISSNANTLLIALIVFVYF